MAIITEIVVLVVALLHGYFMVLEMFLWDKPTGLKAFGQSKEKAIATKVLAANQGLYVKVKDLPDSQPSRVSDY
ncbi:MAG: Protein of unknown function DUF1304 [Olavius algarvensis Delta 4 endosymbiont]|nr:MAG: Protein of unknown function DUF1304 [Olavius algarvensis Delta 4 endosymbiont]